MNLFENMKMMKSLEGNKIEVKTLFVDMAEDFISGMVASVLVEKFLNAKNIVSRDGEDWVTIRREEFAYEMRISPKQMDRALKILEEKNMIKTKKFVLNGLITKHIKLTI